MQTVSRPQFQGAIEAGIRNVGYIRGDDHNLDIEALRTVGRRASLVAVGSYMRPLDAYTVCKCPVSLAHDDFGGLYGDLAFANAFDDAMYQVVPRDTRIVLVVD